MGNRGSSMPVPTHAPKRGPRSTYKEPEPSPIEESFWASAKDVIPELEREVWIGKYRVDFLVGSKKVVIELYGYQWHSSKEKLTRDAERERFLQRQGYHIVRFTGSEVYKNPQKCVREVLEYMRTLPEPSPSSSRPVKVGNRSATRDPYSPVISSTSDPVALTQNNESVHSEEPLQSRKVALRRSTWSKTWLKLKPWQRKLLIGLFVLDVGFLLFAVLLLLR